MILLPCLLGLLLWKQLPQELPTHFSIAGQTNGWSGKGFAVFGIPLICLASQWLCLWGMERDITVPYEEITAVEYRDTAVEGERIWGFASLKLEMGQFQNEEFGDYTHYTYMGCNSAVIVHLGQEILVLGAADEVQTAQLAQQLARSR